MVTNIKVPEDQHPMTVVKMLFDQVSAGWKPLDKAIKAATLLKLVLAEEVMTPSEQDRALAIVPMERYYLTKTSAYREKINELERNNEDLFNYLTEMLKVASPATDFEAGREFQAVATLEMIEALKNREVDVYEDEDG